MLFLVLINHAIWNLGQDEGNGGGVEEIIVVGLPDTGSGDICQASSKYASPLLTSS